MTKQNTLQEEELMYAVAVNGQLVTKPVHSVELAQQSISQLAEGMQVNARVVAVTSNGNQLLLG